MKIMKKILSSFLILCCTFIILPSTVFAQEQKTVTGTFTAVSMNVDGLPQTILGIGINEDGPGSDGTRAISAKMAEYDWDIIGVSEDFNYNNELMSSLTAYNAGTHRGGVSWLTNNTDGLNLIWKKDISVTGESWTSWNTSYSTGIFNTGNGADGMIDKGFRYYQAEVAEGVKIDIYILHMDADSDQGDIDARHAQLTQLADAVKASQNGNPIIVMGDTNCRYTREELKSLFIDRINADERFTIQDAWIENVRNGQYPNVGDDALVAVDKGGTYEYPQAEIVDKMFYINNTDSQVTLSLDSYDVADDFTSADGAALADHWPIVGTFTYSVEQEEDTHTHNYVMTDETLPTCTEAGSRTYTCECGESYTERLEALGHNYVDGICTNCGAAEPGTGADFVLGQAEDSIESGSKYALVTSSSTLSYALTYESDGTISWDYTNTAEGTTAKDGMAWTVEQSDNGYTISTEIDGVKKYLARTKIFAGYGYKIALQDTPFEWTVKYNASTGGFRINTKVVLKDYALRYYNSATGWIVTTKGMDIRLYVLQENAAQQR